MGRLSDINERINGVAQKYANVSTKIRGLPLYIDPLLTGQSRFSRKTGSIGLVNPDIQIFLAEAAQQNQQQITVNRFNEWFQEGFVICLNYVEKFKITDIQGQVYALDTTIKVRQEASTAVNLYAVPILALNDYTTNDSVIRIRSKFKMLTGDVLAFELYQNIFIECEITDLVDLGETNNPYNYTYEVTLNKKIPKALKADELFYMRAYPAYFSKILRLPANPVSGQAIGPFVVDYFGGKIVNGPSPDVFLSIQTYDLFSNEILTTSPMNIKPNYPIPYRSFDSTSMIFWDLIAGEFKLSGSNAVMITDDDGNFGVCYDAQPNFNKGSSWKVSVTCSNDTVLRFGFEPNEFVTYNLSPGTTTILVGNKNLQSYNKLTVVGTSSAGATIEFSRWQLQELEVDRISYGIMARVEKEAVWLASGLIIKPLFLSIDYLTTNYDSDTNYDSGLIYF